MDQPSRKETLTYAQLTGLITERLEALGIAASDFAPPIVIAASDGIANWTTKPSWRVRLGQREIAIASVMIELRREFDLI